MKQNNSTPRPFLTPLGAWALSLGCAVGWGSFMMPGTTFLPLAGPLGTVLGIGIGAVIMLLVGVNYHYMMGRYPDAGGSFSYVKNTFDFDHGFVAAWFLLLSYIAIVWANATALPLIGRFLLGDLFQVGLHYRIAGFDIYLGEVLLAVGALALFSFLCLNRRAAVLVQIVMVFVLCAGVLFCAGAVFRHMPGGFSSMRPAFAPGKSPVIGVFTIVAMGPWAFVGFESISHAAGEFKFPVKKALPIMALSLLVGAGAYALLALIAASTVPAGFSGWPAYIAALDTLERTEAAPTFYAVRQALGPAATPILVFTVLGGVITGLVGNTFAASRLVCALAREGLMPKQFAKLNRDGAPQNAILLILAVSVVIPLFGRTAVGWIVDVTTVGAAIVYAYTSACAYKRAREADDRFVTATGLIGVVISLVFLLYYLVPNLLAVSALARESYLILALWSLLGLIVFRYLLGRDEARRLGHSTIVWIVTLSLIFFTSLVWMRERSTDLARSSIDEVSAYYVQELQNEGAERSQQEARREADFLERQKSGFSSTLTANSIIQISFMVLSMVTLFSIYGVIHKRERQIEREKLLAEESSRAKTSFLSNMSHEIRTPMNAIIGLDSIALKDPELKPRTREQLEKIGASAQHLLSLINDILDLSRIESGRMTVDEEEFSLTALLDQVSGITESQCREKGICYTFTRSDEVSDYYRGDEAKLRQVLTNILSNAVKYTDSPGSVSFTAEETARFDDFRTLRFGIKDTGVGMSKAYLARVFDPFSLEDTASVNRYGSTGLGMTIVKNLVEMMNGEIRVESEKGVGTEFAVTVTLRAAEHSAPPGPGEEPDYGEALRGMRVLIAEGIDLNADVLADLLDMYGVKSERAENGQIALERFSRHEAGYYGAILMDVRMPVMDGLRAAAAIRALPRADAALIPIIALTANAFDDDVQRSLQAGMNAHLSKPVEPERLYEAIKKLTRAGT